MSAHEPRCSDNAGARAIAEQRQLFNEAIASKDSDTIESLLSNDVLLLTGTDSAIYRGRGAQVELWAQDFARAERLIYVRTSTCIDVSSDYPIALEHGHWRGVPAAEPQSDAVFSGRYSAKWRQEDGVWRLETETYMTDCGGEGCAGDDES